MFFLSLCLPLSEVQPVSCFPRIMHSLCGRQRAMLYKWHCRLDVVWSSLSPSLSVPLALSRSVALLHSPRQFVAFACRPVMVWLSRIWRGREALCQSGTAIQTRWTFLHVWPLFHSIFKLPLSPTSSLFHFFSNCHTQRERVTSKLTLQTSSVSSFSETIASVPSLPSFLSFLHSLDFVGWLTSWRIWGWKQCLTALNEYQRRVYHVFVIHILCYLKGTLRHHTNPKHDEGKGKKGWPEVWAGPLLQLDTVDPARRSMWQQSKTLLYLVGIEIIKQTLEICFSCMMLFSGNQNVDP